MFHGEELKTLIHNYIELYSKPFCSERTLQNKRDTFRLLIRWLGDRTFNQETLQEYIDCLDSKIAASSRNTALRTIKAFTNYLYSTKGMLDIDFGKSIKYAKEKKKKLELVKQEIFDQIIIEGCKSGAGDNSINKARKLDMMDAMRIALRTGMRFSEFSNLKAENIILDIDDPMIIIEDAKGGDDETVPLPKDMVPMLKERANKIGSGQLFKITDFTCNKAIKRGMERLGITTKKLTVHALRHCFATSLLLKGVPLHEVSRLLRHHSVELTHDIYSHYSLKDLSSIVNTKQNLVRMAVSPDEVFNDMIDTITKTGIQNDPRFRKTVRKDRNRLIIEIELI